MKNLGFGTWVKLALLLATFTPAAAPVGATAGATWQRYWVLSPPGSEEPDPAVFRKVKRLLYVAHKVQKGEYSVWHLAKLYGTTPMSLQTTNGEELLLLYPGKSVTVHNKNGQLYEVRREKETLDSIVSRYHKTRSQAARFKESVVYANKLPGSALLGEYELSRGSRLLLPDVKISFDTYHFPFQGWGWGRVSSRFGSRYHPLLKRRKFHDGLDIAKPWGTPVYPARNGRVIETGWHEGYGLLVVIRHADGATTRYGHLSKIHAQVGDAVVRGKSLIGRVGSTGLSTGPHLHFEVRDKNGRPVNPGSKIGRR